jgi:hypothetical protein
MSNIISFSISLKVYVMWSHIIFGENTDRSNDIVNDITKSFL